MANKNVRSLINKLVNVLITLTKARSRRRTKPKKRNATEFGAADWLAIAFKIGPICAPEYREFCSSRSPGPAIGVRFASDYEHLRDNSLRIGTGN